MTSTIKRWRYFAVCLLSAGVLLSALHGQTAYAQTGITNTVDGEVIVQEEQSSSSCNASLLGFPAWYKGIAKGSDCEIVSPTEVGGIASFIWIIVLNVVEMLLRAAGYAAVGFIIY